MARLRVRTIRGKIYFICVTRDRRELSAGKTRKNAKEFVDNFDHLERLQKHGLPLPRKSSWTLKDLKDWDVRTSSDPSRERRWRMILKGFGESTYLDEVTPQAIESYRERRLATPAAKGKRIAGPATVNRDCSVLSSALKRARTQPGVVIGKPFEEIAPLSERQLRKKPVSRPPEEIRKFIQAAWEIAAAPPPHVDRREWDDNAAMIELLYMTASRLSQVLRLRAEQVKGKLLSFPGHKRGTERAFVLSGRLAELLASRGGEGGWLFPSHRRDGPRREFRRFWKLVEEKAEIGHLTPHALRHSASSALFQAGGMIDEVQRLLGHQTPALAIALYTQLFPKPIEPISFHILSGKKPRRRAVRRGRSRAAL